MWTWVAKGAHPRLGAADRPSPGPRSTPARIRHRPPDDAPRSTDGRGPSAGPLTSWRRRPRLRVDRASGPVILPLLAAGRCQNPQAERLRHTLSIALPPSARPSPHPMGGGWRPRLQSGRHRGRNTLHTRVDPTPDSSSPAPPPPPLPWRCVVPIPATPQYLSRSTALVPRAPNRTGANLRRRAHSGIATRRGVAPIPAVRAPAISGPTVPRPPAKTPGYSAAALGGSARKTIPESGSTGPRRQPVLNRTALRPRSRPPRPTRQSSGA